MAKDKKKKSGKGKVKVETMVRDRFKALGNNKAVADVVAAALVATAAALKDSDKARRFASEAGDQLEKLSKEGAERGNVMWALALDIGRRALESAGTEKPAKGARSKAKPPAKPKSPAKPKGRAKPKTAARLKAPAATKAPVKTGAKRTTKKA